MAKKTKKPQIGRPAGLEKKVPVNLFMTKTRKDRLKEYAAKEQKTQSIIVENALQQAFGI